MAKIQLAQKAVEWCMKDTPPRNRFYPQDDFCFLLVSPSRICLDTWHTQTHSYVSVWV